MVRLYFNKRGPEVWVLDGGPGTRKETFSTEGLNTLFGSQGNALLVGENLSEPDPENKPLAWVEFRNGMDLEATPEEIQ